MFPRRPSTASTAPTTPSLMPSDHDVESPHSRGAFDPDPPTHPNRVTEPEVQQQRQEEEQQEQQEQLQIQQQQQQVQHHTQEIPQDSAPCKNLASSLRAAVWTWIRVIMRSGGVLCGTLFLVSAYYLPGRLLLGSHRDAGDFAQENNGDSNGNNNNNNDDTDNDTERFIKTVIYDIVRGLIGGAVLHASYALLAVRIFSFRVARPALVAVILPAVSIDLALHSIPARNSRLVAYALNALAAFTPIAALLYLRRAHASRLQSVYPYIPSRSDLGSLSHTDPSHTDPDVQSDSAMINQIDAQGESHANISGHAPSSVGVVFQDVDSIQGLALLQDGTVPALIKGLLIFFVVIFSLKYTLPAYLDASFQTQMLMRLIVIPYAGFIVSFFQHFILLRFSPQAMAKRLLPNVCSAQYLQFLGRIMVSNVSAGFDSSQYIYINASMSIVEFLCRVTYKRRYFLFSDVRRSLHAMLGQSRAADYRVESMQVIQSPSISSGVTPRHNQISSSSSNVLDPNLPPTASSSSATSVSTSIAMITTSASIAASAATSSSGSAPSSTTAFAHFSAHESGRNAPPHRLLRHVMRFSLFHFDGASYSDPTVTVDEAYARVQVMRARQIIEESGTEIRVLVFAPLLMYFVHPLYPETAFQTLYSFRDVIYQVAVQFIFEAIGDIAAMWVEIHSLGIPLYHTCIKESDHAVIFKILFSIFCFLHFQSLVATY